LDLAGGADVAKACRTAGSSDATLLYLVQEVRQDGQGAAGRTQGACNGPEFSSETFIDWLTKVGIKPIRIYPGSPWENGYNERFNGTLRTEVLNAEWFSTTRQAQTVINQWLKQYNHIRPHHALGMRPPVPETCLVNQQITGT
jgi:transposase InsO family protein